MATKGEHVYNRIVHGIWGIPLSNVVPWWKLCAAIPSSLHLCKTYRNADPLILQELFLCISAFHKAASGLLNNKASSYFRACQFAMSAPGWGWSMTSTNWRWSDWSMDRQGQHHLWLPCSSQLQLFPHPLCDKIYLCNQFLACFPLKLSFEIELNFQKLSSLTMKVAYAKLKTKHFFLSLFESANASFIAWQYWK